jgi:hypothetical protein
VNKASLFPKKTTAASEAPWKASTSAAVATSFDGGPVFFLNQETISGAVLPPLYSDGVPLTKNFKVGYP